MGRSQDAASGRSAGESLDRLTNAAESWLQADSPAWKLASTALPLHSLGLEGTELWDPAIGSPKALSRAETAGVTVTRRAWWEGVGPQAAAFAAELAAGRPLLVFSDPAAPAVARGAVEALWMAGVPEEVLDVVDDSTDVELRATLEKASVTRLALQGDQEMQERVAPWLEGKRGGNSSFGAGVVELPDIDCEFQLGCAHELTVKASDDPTLAATYVAGRAFGVGEKLGGQGEGLERVFVPPRRLSRFTENLLTELEGQEWPEIPPVERSLGRYLEDVRSLGLDEGATLIHEARERSPRGGGEGRIVRLVFTNCEPRMRLFRLTRPAPVLLLSRSEGTPAPELSL